METLTRIILDHIRRACGVQIEEQEVRYPETGEEEWRLVATGRDGETWVVRAEDRHVAACHLAAELGIDLEE